MASASFGGVPERARRATRSRSSASTRACWALRKESRSKGAKMSVLLGGRVGDELADAPDELVHVQRLHEVVRGPHLQAVALVLRLCPPADEDDGDLPEVLVLLH